MRRWVGGSRATEPSAEPARIRPGPRGRRDRDSPWPLQASFILAALFLRTGNAEKFSGRRCGTRSEVPHLSVNLTTLPALTAFVQ
jgi:hypothetical protein